MFEIRLVQKEDAKDMLEYLKKVGGETDFLLFGNEGIPLSLKEEETLLERMNQSPYAKMYIVKDKDLIIGNASIHTSTKPRIQHKAELAISVLKSYWGKGVSKLLMNQVIDYAKNSGFIEMILLEVATTNSRAIKFYEFYGFKSYGVARNAVKMDQGYLDWELMRLDV